ncbi:MAG: hypothetical protein FJ118_20750 [Deltaproteobacteria bacterium]|nr:hypothetical protein [Deltaproteobacteria bacterium]
MFDDEEIIVTADLSEEFRGFEEFCVENAGRESVYLRMVAEKPLEMDSITLAFSMRHLVRLSKDLMEMLLKSVTNEDSPDLATMLGTKGIQLDKSNAEALRKIIFAFKDAPDQESSGALARAFQLMTMSRHRRRIKLTLTESYAPSEEGWLAEDFGGDDSLLETVRSIESPHWTQTEET